MDEKPEALRLAEVLLPVHHKVAAELRRLSEVNTELLEVLKEVDSWLACACIATPEDMAQSFPHMQQVVSAAISKAEGK